MRAKEHFHGSDLEKIEKVYGIKREDIISFSANVNPLGISTELKETLTEHINVITQYPDREYTSLRRAIAKYTNSDIKNIIVGNGTTELISLFIRIAKPKKALIAGPTYSEYEREVATSGGRSHYFSLDEKKGFKLDTPALTKELSEDFDLLIICNPNNPTSSVIKRDQMREILDFCKRKSITVLVDETYVEFTDSPDDVTSIPLTQYYTNLIILRGVSKFFAAPGLRLGYAICGNRDIEGAIESMKNPWTVGSLAAVAGELMFTDTDYIEKTRHLINTERERVTNMLINSGLYKVYTPQANFVLLRILTDGVTSDMLFDRAIRKGYMIRDCSSFPFLNDRYIRFCFMLPEQNDALTDVLTDGLGGGKA